MAKPKKRGLGKGLDALLSPASPSAPRTERVPSLESGVEVVLQLDPRIIEPNPQQPRTTFQEEALEELADSIRRDGVQEPVLVRQVQGVYQLVSGERRVRASIMADKPTIPAICRDVSDADMLKLGLIENIQREDLNAIELARGYQQLITEFEWTQEELAGQVGKKRATVTNTLRLLNLPSDVQRCVADQQISMGHARALLALDSPQAQSAACRKIIAEGLSVRQTEKLTSPQQQKKPRKQNKDPDLVGIEDDLRRRLGTRVTIRASGKNRGKIELEYYNLDDFERILDLFRR